MARITWDLKTTHMRPWRCWVTSMKTGSAALTGGFQVGMAWKTRQQATRTQACQTLTNR